jgi:hypothetical protein
LFGVELALGAVGEILHRARQAAIAKMLAHLIGIDPQLRHSVPRWTLGARQRVDRIANVLGNLVG